MPTVSVTAGETTVPKVAVIWLVPLATPVASPVAAPMVATEVGAEAQVT